MTEGGLLAIGALYLQAVALLDPFVVELKICVPLGGWNPCFVLGCNIVEEPCRVSFRDRLVR